MFFRGGFAIALHLLCSLLLLELLSACDLYIAPSTVPGAGLGLFAGKKYNKDDSIAIDDSLLIPFDSCEANQLTYYVFGTDEDTIANLNLGVFMLMNHRLPKNTQGHLVAIPEPSAHFILKAAHTTYPPVLLSAEEDIEEGGEIFTSYGGDEWFTARNMSAPVDIDAVWPQKSLSQLAAQGHCLTDVEGKKSGFPNAGRGLFAARDFKEGEIVSVSPALLVSKKMLMQVSSQSLMINYAISSKDSDAAVVPLGRGALANNDSRERSNLVLAWYDWNTKRAGYDINKITGKSLSEMSKSSAGAVNVAYVATRDIRAGEELTLYYGSNWEAKWAEYVNSMNRLHSSGRANNALLAQIRFREPIGAPEGMFPSSWFSKATASPQVEL